MSKESKIAVLLTFVALAAMIIIGSAIRSLWLYPLGSTR
jgi:hypothetical protein